MRVRSLAVAALAVCLAVMSIGVALRAQAGSYVKLAEIKVGGAGAFDYLTVDPGSKRLYLSHGTEVVVIDLTTNAVIGKITDTPGVHGIAVAPGPDGHLFTSNGRE